MSRAIYIGLDVGASTTKAVIIGSNKEILGHGVTHSGANFRTAADKALRQARKGLAWVSSRGKGVVATGYGRRNVADVDATITEISCHAKGSYHFFPHAHTLVDIGGQDSKVIKVNAAGRRIGFKMNRKCAAGTGAFIEEIANRMKIKLEALDTLAQQATKDVEIGSYCTVFTATEILTKIRQNIDIKEIIRGIFASVIKRALEMDPLQGDIVMTGGVVAYNPFLVKMFEEKVGKPIYVPPLPQLTGAFGAALFALEAKGGLHA